MARKKLNERQQKFLDLYLSGIMPTAAYKKAYECKKKVAQVNAYRLLENASIKEAIEDAKKRDRERNEKRLNNLAPKSIDNIESALNLNENDPTLNFFKMMAIQHKTKTAENVLNRLGYKAPEKVEHSGSLDLTWKEIIYGTTKEKNNDIETEGN